MTKWEQSCDKAGAKSVQSQCKVSAKSVQSQCKTGAKSVQKYNEKIYRCIRLRAVSTLWGEDVWWCWYNSIPLKHLEHIYIDVKWCFPKYSVYLDSYLDILLWV